MKISEKTCKRRLLMYGCFKATACAHDTDVEKRKRRIGFDFPRKVYIRMLLIKV